MVAVAADPLRPARGAERLGEPAAHHRVRRALAALDRRHQRQAAGGRLGLGEVAQRLARGGEVLGGQRQLGLEQPALRVAGRGGDQRREALAPGRRGLVGLDRGEGGGEVGMRVGRPGRGQRLASPCAWRRSPRAPAPPAPPPGSASAPAGSPAAPPRCRGRCCRRRARRARRPATAPRRAGCRRRAAAAARASRRSASRARRPSPPAWTAGRRACAAPARCRGGARSAFLRQRHRGVGVALLELEPHQPLQRRPGGCGRSAASPCRPRRPSPGRRSSRRPGRSGAGSGRAGSGASRPAAPSSSPASDRRRRARPCRRSARRSRARSRLREK